jgi:hypothetical protein
MNFGGATDLELERRWWPTSTGDIEFESKVLDEPQRLPGLYSRRRLHGVELCGATVGRGDRPIKDLRSGALGSSPQHLLNHNSILYFSADNGPAGRELWRSTGFGPKPSWRQY